MYIFLILLVPGILGDHSEKAALEFMKKQNELRAELANKNTIASWNYESNLTEKNKKIMLDTALETAKELKKQWEETIKYPWKSYKDENLKRQFKEMSILGSAALSDEKQKELNELSSDMTEIYSKGKVCDFKDKNKCDLSLEPELKEIFSSSRNPEELKHYWKKWRDVSGKKIRDKYIRMASLLNEAAKLNNFTNAADEWQYDFESETFEKDIEDLLDQVSPLYNQLHAYVRRKLYEKYGENVVPKNGPIPAHLLGNMWAQDWDEIYDLLEPFQDSKKTKLHADSVTLEMKRQNITALKMFKMAEEFFTSLNLSAMPPIFWEKSIIEKPKGVELTCHASAWDFYDGKDFRIKQCTTVNLNDLLVVHHEMGHIQYYIQYKDQPYVFRRGANSGFHEAIGDIMSLSVGTDKHLEKIGLKKAEEKTKEKMIKTLLKVALSRIAFLPFGYLIDQYRWDIFKGKTQPENLNCAWWTLREKYQGVSSPVDRTEEDFDAGAKYHVPANVPYVRYFVSHILLFQFHESLCKAAGEYDPSVPEKQYLHECDIYSNFTNAAEQWQDDFESETFEKDIEDLLNQVSPLYNQLHAFVRRKLYLKYGEDVVPKTGPIPAHLLGNMWAQDWVNIWDVLNPFPDANAESQDAITLEMKKQNFTSLKMFKMAEEFFTSLNLSAMPPLFWEKSIIEKPKGVELTCHASAWDFYDGKDFRIKQCTSVKLHDFLVIHHEMGHIQYFIQYKDQPYVFRRGANSGFHEAIGDIMSLSVGTDKHLEKIGLKKSEVRTKEKIIESLLKVALSQIAFLPFGYLIDQYRWDIFKGKTKPENFNCDWWSLREKYQGVNSPLERNEDDFDAGAKYHVPANVPYVRYFVSHILLFQFHESLCKAAEEYDPSVPEKQYLHECDIFNSKKAGNLLGQMLRLGSSKPWPEALEMVTGTKRMDAAAVLNYFKPLYDWLVEENKKTEEYIGWKITKPSCT